MRPEFRIKNSEFRIPRPDPGRGRWGLGVLLVTCHLSLVTAAFGATHVTATYDLGANPRVMATVNGTPMYGLVFAQRNKQVTYGGVEYGPSVVKGYLNASGQLNDGAGNLWLDLVPNLGATPGDSYYVLTFNIQGRVHAEIWVVPDVATVAAEVCRQAQPPSSTAPALFYQFLQQDGDDFPQRQKLNFTGSGVSCVDNAGQLRTDCTVTGGGGGSAPKASATVSGTVKTDATESDPVVYLKSSADTLLAAKAALAHSHAESEVTNLVTDLAGKVPSTRAVGTTAPLAGGGDLSADRTLSCPTCSVNGHGHTEAEVTNLVGDLAAKVPTSRNVNTSSPLGGGGALSSDLTLTCATCEVTGSKNTANGYAGLGSDTKLAASQLPLPGTTTLGGVKALTCGGTDKLSAIGTDGAPVCSTDQTGGGSLTVKEQDGNPSVGSVDTIQFDQTDGFTVTDLTGGDVQIDCVDASGSAKGCLTAANWSTFNGKQDALGFTPENSANKNAASGYAGLTSGTKLNLAQMQEVMSSADLSDLSGVFGTSPGTKAATTALGADPTTDNCVKWIAGGKLGDAGAACGTGGGITTLNTLTEATQSFATGTSGTDFNISSATSTHTFNLPVASASVTGRLSSTDWSAFNGKPDLATTGTNGTAAYNAGDDVTAARSDHTHRSIHNLTWYFPGTPATGAQALTLTIPEGVTNVAITDMRVTVNTTSSGSSTFNVQRCTASCTGTSPTFSNIYSTNLTLSASTRTAAKGSAPDQNVSGLASGDQFKANLITIGSALADVTVTLTVKYEATN